MFVLFLAIVLPTASALAQQPVGIVAVIDGAVTVIRAGASSPIPLRFKDSVFPGDRIEARAESLLKMLIGGKALLTVRELSSVTITEDQSKTVIRMDANPPYGSSKVAVHTHKLEQSIEIRTPNAIAQVRGGLVIVEAVGSMTHIDCGVGDCSGGSIPAGSLQIPPGQGLTITENVLGPLRPIRPDAMRGLVAKPRPGHGQKPKPYTTP